MRYPLLLFTIAALTTSAPSLLAQHATNTRSPDPLYGDLTADQQVLQVLNRLTFGPRPGDIAQVREIGIKTWIDQQLHPDHIPDPTVDQLLASYPLVNQDQNALAQEYAQFIRDRAAARQARRDTSQQADPDEVAEFKRLNQERLQLATELNSERVARAVMSNRQLLEVMTDFWENHFNIYNQKGAPEVYYLVDFDKTIREHALGKFRDLLGAVAHSPAMLFYLDNAESQANPDEPTLLPDRLRQRLLADARQKKKQPAGLNENYGRELLELHTLGVDGGYTQQDVINVARALTGWTIKPPAQGGGFIFRPAIHDAGEKVVLGHTLSAGRGEEDGEDVLDILARSPATAHFIALKLARRFVSDSPSTALVDRAAQTFMRTDGDIREVVRTIVTSPEFFARAAYRSKVKSPFEVVVSTARALDAQPDTSPRTAFVVAYMGQPIFGHQDPNGWPETGDAWMNTGAILNRINFGMAVAANRLPGASITTLPWADSVWNATREQQVDAVVANILGGAISSDMRQILMCGEHPFAAQAAAQATTQAGQTEMAAGNTPDMSANTSSGGDDPMMMTQQPKRIKKTTLATGTDTGKRAAQPGQGAAFGRNGFGPPPNLTGLPQIIGFALGSPEFQRR